MRLIDADALIDDMVDYVVDGYAESRDDFEEYTKMVQTAPTIDAVEVVRGKWKRKIVDDGFNADWVCSECGYRIKTDFVDYNYCPKCGAKMKGEDDD